MYSYKISKSINESNLSKFFKFNFVIKFKIEFIYNILYIIIHIGFISIIYPLWI